MDGDVATGGGGSAGTSIHITALDGIVNVNSLFTLAAFLGLAWRPSSDGPGLADGADRTGNPCAAGDRAESDLVPFPSPASSAPRSPTRSGIRHTATPTLHSTAARHSPPPPSPSFFSGAFASPARYPSISDSALNTSHRGHGARTGSSLRGQRPLAARAR